MFEAIDVQGIHDTPQNIKLLMQSDAQINLRLLAGKAQKINNLRNEFTGWYRREIANDGMCSTIGGGVLLFKTNPLVVKRIESQGKAPVYADTYAHAFAMDNSIEV